MKKTSFRILTIVIVLTMLSTNMVFAFGLPGALGGIGGGTAVDVEGLSASAIRLQAKVLFATWMLSDSITDSLEAAGKTEEAGKIAAQKAAAQEDLNNTEKTKALLTSLKQYSTKESLNQTLANIDEEKAGELVQRASLKSTAGKLALLTAIPDVIKVSKDIPAGVKNLSRDPLGNASGIKQLKSGLVTINFIKETGPVVQDLLKTYSASMNEYANNKNLPMASESDAQSYADGLGKEE